MSYTWLGMRHIPWNEVILLHETTGLQGYYLLSAETNFKRMIDSYYDWEEIQKHHEKGGEIGELLDTVELELAGGKEIEVPEMVDLTKSGCLEELGYQLWGMIEEYMVLFGIRTKDDSPDWETVKAVQGKIIQELMDAGVCFKFDSDRETEKEYCRCGNVFSSNSYYWLW